MPAEPSNKRHGPMENEDHENVSPPAAICNHAPSMADPSPAPQGKPNRNTPDGGGASLYREVRDKHYNAMAICVQSPIRSPASYYNLSDETLPEVSMLDSTVETSHLSAAASHSPFPRYTREMKSALTPVFKYKNNTNVQSPRSTRPEEATWLPDFWLQDESPPEVELSHLFTPVASPSVMPRLPMAVDLPVQPELDTTQVLTGNGVDVVNNQETPTGSRNDTLISPQDDASVNTNITMEKVDSSGSKGNETSSRNKTLESNPVSIGPSASVSLAYSGFRVKDIFEIVSPPTQSAPSCSQDDQSGGQDDQSGDQDDQSGDQDDQNGDQDDQSDDQDDQSNGPDDQSSSQDDQIGSRSNQSSEDNNRIFEAVPTALSSEPPANSTLVTVVELPSQSKISTTPLVSGKVAEAVSNATFVSPQGNGKLPTPLANITITMELECSGSESDKPTLRNKTLESNPVYIGLGTSVSLADALTGIRLQDTFETANQSGRQDDQSGGQDDQSGSQDDQSSKQGHQMGSRSSEDNHRTFEAVPTALSSEPCANSTLITAVAFPTQSKISTTQLVSGNAQDDVELPNFKANINVTMEMERSGSKSDENLLQNKILDMTPIAGTCNRQHEITSPAKPSALTCCQDNQTFGPLDIPLTSTPMPDRKDLAAITQTSEVQKRLYADGPSKPLPQMSPSTTSPDHALPRPARSLLPTVRPVSHLLRYNPALFHMGRPEPHPLIATQRRVNVVAPPPHESKPKTTGIPNTTRLHHALPGLKQPSRALNKAAPTGIPSTNRTALVSLRPPSARLAAAASSNDKPTVASAAKPDQSLSQTKRSLQPRSEAVSLAKKKRTDVPGPSTTVEASCVSVEPTRMTRSLRGPAPGLAPPPHPPRTLALAAKPDQSLSQTKRSLQPRSEAVSLAKKKRTDVPGPSTTVEASCVSVEPTRMTRSLRGPAPGLAPPPHPPRTLALGLKQPSRALNKAAPTGIPSTNRTALVSLRPPPARLAAAASSNDKPTVASAAKPDQSLSQTKRSLQPRSEAVSLAKKKRTDVPGPSTTVEASCVSVEPTRMTRSLRGPAPGLAPPPHPPRTLAQAACAHCALLRQEVEKKDAEVRRLQKELQKCKAEQRRTKH